MTSLTSKHRIDFTKDKRGYKRACDMINSVYSSSKVEARRSKYMAKIPVSSRTQKIMELLRTFVVVGTVLRRGRIFQGSDEV